MPYALCNIPQAVPEQFAVWQHLLSCRGTNVIQVCWCQGDGFDLQCWVDGFSQLASP